MKISAGHDSPSFFSTASEAATMNSEFVRNVFEILAAPWVGSPRNEYHVGTEYSIVERLDDVALEKRWEKTKNVDLWMGKTRLRVHRMTRLGVRISRRMSQTRPLYRENSVNQDLELAEDIQCFGGTL